MRARIILSIITSFIIAFSILCLSLFLYHYNFEGGKWVLQEDNDLIKQKTFLSHNVPVNQKKVFIIGSSHVGVLNPILIRDDLQKNNLNYTVYNLSVPGDTPTLRLKTIDLIISAKPTMIIYGISDRDFRTDEGITNTNEVNLLPNIQNVLADQINAQIVNSRIDTDYLSSPKLDFLKFTFGTNNTQNPNQIFYFDPYLANAWLEKKSEWGTSVSDVILDEEKLDINSELRQILPLDKNKNFLEFKTMISKLQDNKIPVIIFLVPQEKYRLEKIGNVDQFNLALNDIIKEFPDVPIYSLWTKYAQMHIWNDATHIVPNTEHSTGRIFSDDVADIITAELGVNKWRVNDLEIYNPDSSERQVIHLIAGSQMNNGFLGQSPSLIFPISNSTLLSIWKERPDLQKAFPEVAKGDLYNIKMWAGRSGWTEDMRLAALIPQGEVPHYLYGSLLSIWKERPDLQKEYPEVANGDLYNLKKWAEIQGWQEDKRLAILTPPEKILAPTGNES